MLYVVALSDVNISKVINTLSFLNSDPPTNASLNIKLIYNDGWKKSCCATEAEPNGNEAEAKQRALDVFKKAEDLYNSDNNGLGTRITFKLVDNCKYL